MSAFWVRFARGQKLCVEAATKELAQMELKETAS